MKKEKDLVKKYTIEDLSELSGYSRRTIRFYIQENIIEPPAGRGRGGFYFDSHLNALLKIKELQGKGLNLESIKNILNRSIEDIDLSSLIAEEKVNRQVWAKYEISDGIELNIRKDIELNSSNKINEIIKLLKLRMKGDLK
jgi:DNA-binding transcriptional MerR regulator